jgi:hypothetical protein
VWWMECLRHNRAMPPVPVPVNLAEKLSTFNDHWKPRIVGDFNGNDLMVVKVKGEFSGTRMRIRMIFSWC